MCIFDHEAEELVPCQTLGAIELFRNHFGPVLFFFIPYAMLLSDGVYSLARNPRQWEKKGLAVCLLPSQDETA